MNQPVTTRTEPLGSTLHVLRADPGTVAAVAAVDWNRHFSLYAVAYHVALISSPSVCSGAAMSLSRRVALKPKARSGVLAASGVHRQPRV